MTSREAFNSTTGPDDVEGPTLASITIHLPREMLDDLRITAASRGCTVTEHIRRCVSLDRKLFVEDPQTHVVATRSDGRTVSVRL